MRAPDPVERKGEFILYTGPMNSGKSETLINHLSNLQMHAGQNVLCFAARENTRDGLNRIKGNNGSYLPALRVSAKKPCSILKQVYAADKKRFVDVVAFDELNLYGYEILNVISQLKSENRLVMGAGLDKSFRGESFGVMPQLKELVNPNIASDIIFNSYCKIAKNGVQCGRNASYTVRLRADSDAKVAFCDKTGALIEGFGYAPYFDPLVIIEKENESLDDLIKYTASCEDCFAVPFKDETLSVYEEILRGKKTNQIDSVHKKEILAMLLKENKIKRVHKYSNKEFVPCDFVYDMKSKVYVLKK